MDRASMHELSLVRKLDSVQTACCSLFQATAPRKQPWQRFLLAFTSIGSLMCSRATTKWFVGFKLCHTVSSCLSRRPPTMSPTCATTKHVQSMWNHVDQPETEREFGCLKVQYWHGMTWPYLCTASSVIFHPLSSHRIPNETSWNPIGSPLQSHLPVPFPCLIWNTCKCLSARSHTSPGLGMGFHVSMGWAYNLAKSGCHLSMGYVWICVYMYTYI